MFCNHKYLWTRSADEGINLEMVFELEIYIVYYVERGSVPNYPDTGTISLSSLATKLCA